MSRDLHRRIGLLESRLAPPAVNIPLIDWSNFSDDDLAEIETLVRRDLDGASLTPAEQGRLQQLAEKIKYFPVGTTSAATSPDHEGIS